MADETRRSTKRKNGEAEGRSARDGNETAFPGDHAEGSGRDNASRSARMEDSTHRCVSTRSDHDRAAGSRCLVASLPAGIRTAIASDDWSAVAAQVELLAAVVAELRLAPDDERRRCRLVFVLYRRVDRWDAARTRRALDRLARFVEDARDRADDLRRHLLHLMRRARRGAQVAH